MPHRTGILIAALSALSALLSIFIRTQYPEPKLPLISGRNNTVLYLTDSSSGLSKSHVASESALLETHPDIQIHWGSFSTPSLETKLSHISRAAAAKNQDVEPIVFHTMNSTSMIQALNKAYPHFDDFITPYGLKSYTKMLDIMERILMPWMPDQYLALYNQTVRLIEEIEPAVIVVDSLQRPLVDAARTAHRPFAMLNPNALADIIAYHQPWGGMFWKYPAMMSGHRLPVPFRSIPANIWMQLRFMCMILTSPKMRAVRNHVKKYGVKDPVNMQMYFDEGPLISGALPEAGYPLDFIPPGITICGPIVLGTAPAEMQDRELVEWLDCGPGTVLVCLGSHILYNESRATALSKAILHVLQNTNRQVLWKFNKEGRYDDKWREPLQEYIASGRLRLESWLKVGPVSLVKTGQVDVWVHHGGANCYFEAARSGVKQVILPLWLDLYNMAQIAEGLGVGIWAGKETAPECETLGVDMMAALEGQGAEVMQQKATTLEGSARKYTGRYCAAEQIAEMAERGR